MSAILDLKDELDQARQQYSLCQFIDDYQRMLKEQDYWAKRISQINDQIAEIEGDDA